MKEKNLDIQLDKLRQTDITVDYQEQYQLITDRLAKKNRGSFMKLFVFNKYALSVVSIFLIAFTLNIYNTEVSLARRSTVNEQLASTFFYDYSEDSSQTDNYFNGTYIDSGLF